MPSEPTPTGTVLALIGEFDITQRLVLKDALKDANLGRLVVLDLRRMDYVDSTVLSQLVTRRAELLENGTDLILVGATELVQRIFDMTQLTLLFDMRTSLDDVPGAAGYRRVEVIADGTPAR